MQPVQVGLFSQATRVSDASNHAAALAVPSPLWLPPLAEAEEEEGAEEEAMSCSFRAEVRKLLCTTPNKCSSSDTLSHMPSLCTAQGGVGDARCWVTSLCCLHSLQIAHYLAKIMHTSSLQMGTSLTSGVDVTAPGRRN